MTLQHDSTVRLAALKIFTTVCEAGSQAAAASQLGMSESKVSRNIDLLEEWLGTILFTNDLPRELTLSGQNFLPLAQAAWRDLSEFKASLSPKG